MGQGQTTSQEELSNQSQHLTSAQGGRGLLSSVYTPRRAGPQDSGLGSSGMPTLLAPTHQKETGQGPVWRRAQLHPQLHPQVPSLEQTG